MPARSHEALRALRVLTPALLFALLAACTTPSGSFRTDAAARGFVAEVTPPGPHRMVMFRNGVAAPGAPLHFYLDGDGAPWVSRRRVAIDPNSREHLILDLMQQDVTASVLVGRPCYYLEKNIYDPAQWTTRRYLKAVISGMAAAMNREIARVPGSPVTVIGHSDGGVLAMLLAPRLNRLDNIVTLATNLDVAAWTRHHGHAPLLGSLDPADELPLPPHIRQRHLFGKNDDNVSARLMRSVAEEQPNTLVRIVRGFDHIRCWVGAWRQLLAEALASEP